jgi:creatinine amidohydrolase
MTSSYAKEMNREEFAAAMKRNPIIVLPIGSMEEHGAHLPLGSDTFEIDFIVERLSKKMDLLILPTINYGNCGSTYNFPGTISIGFETLKSLIIDILREIIRHKGRRVLVISGHAGSNHMVAMRQAAQTMVKGTPGLKIMVMSDYDLVPGYKGGSIPSWDGHAGKAETSRMLNIRPDISKRGKTATKAKYQEFMILPNPEIQFPTGVSGDPRRASAELGRKIDEYVLRRLMALIKKNLGSGD